MTRSVLLFAIALLASDVAAQEPLRRGATVVGTLASGDTITYAIDAQADAFVLGQVDQRTVDAVVRVTGPDGRQVLLRNGSERGPEIFAFETAAEGRHLVQVAPIEDEVGEYAISLQRLEPVESDPKKLVDQLMSPYDREDSPGAAVSVWRDGRTLFSKAYGMANLGYGIPFETDTRTNIGSTSKQFTAFAVMLQADRGKLSLDDDIRVHVPELPEFDETITVRHLITHTSGLREFLNLLSMTGRRLDHGDFIDRSELIEIVQRQPALQNAPGAEFNYNNTAFGLAALIVERTSGKDFPDFMRDNVFEPLGMNDTMVRPSPEHIVPNKSEGYTPSGDGYLEIGDLGGAVGAGAIYSTVGDLKTWAENYANPHVGSREIVDAMTTSFVLTDGEESGYGYGLFIDDQRGLRRVHHGGADVAHRSMLAMYPEIGAGITTQSNHAAFDSNVAFRIAAAFFGSDMEPEPESMTAAGGHFDPDSYDPADFDELVGRYALDAAPTFILSFTREDDTLFTQATGQQRLEIEPRSDSTFVLLAVDASVTFHRNAEGEVDGATLDQNGQQQHATRLEGDAAAEAWAPTPEELADFEGRYFSEELETFYMASVVDDRLQLHQRRLGDSPVTAGDRDTFTGGGMTFTFERDRNDQVIGFYLSNVRTRDVRFERVR